MTAIPMTNLRWCDVKHFKPKEFTYKGKDVSNEMDYYLINRLDQFREMVGKPIVIHSSYRESDTGYHGTGEAVDFHIAGINVFDAFLLAEKSGLFGGIGVYPNWNNPGLHLDIRQKPSRWGCWTPTDPKKKNIYVPLDSEFWKRFVREKMNDDRSNSQISD